MTSSTSWNADGEQYRVVILGELVETFTDVEAAADFYTNNCCTPCWRMKHAGFGTNCCAILDVDEGDHLMAEIEAHCPVHGVLYEPRCHYCREYAGRRSRPSAVQHVCDRCTQGVMDVDGPNGPGDDHLYGRCRCACHETRL